MFLLAGQIVYGACVLSDEIYLVDKNAESKHAEHKTKDDACGTNHFEEVQHFLVN